MGDPVRKMGLFLQKLLKPTSYLTGLSLAAAISLPSLAQESKPLRVGVAGSAPFVIQEGKSVTGIALDVWEEVAADRQLDYQLIPYPSVPQGIQAVSQRELDLLIGPISITPNRLESDQIEFTQPYFVANIGLLLPAKPPSLWSRVAPFFGLAAVSSSLVLIALLFVVGNLIWLAERRRNPEQFPPDYPNGVRNGIWFALVTLTTVGYGDRAPITKLGQFIAGVWMIVTLVAVSSITAGLASAFTAALSEAGASEEFQTLRDLRGASIAVVAGTTAVKWAQYYDTRIEQTQSLEEAIDRVVRGQAEGVIFDRPALLYYLRQNPDLPLRMSPLTVASETYGFVLPANSSFKKKLSVEILELIDGRRLLEIAEKWLSREDGNLTTLTRKDS